MTTYCQNHPLVQAIMLFGAMPLCAGCFWDRLAADNPEQYARYLAAGMLKREQERLDELGENAVTPLVERICLDCITSFPTALAKALHDCTGTIPNNAARDRLRELDEARRV